MTIGEHYSLAIATELRWEFLLKYTVAEVYMDGVVIIK